MSSFIYPNSEVRKIYGKQGQLAIRRRIKFGKDQELKRLEKEKLLAESKAKIGPKQSFITKAFMKIRNLFKRS